VGRGPQFEKRWSRFILKESIYIVQIHNAEGNCMLIVSEINILLRLCQKQLFGIQCVVVIGVTADHNLQYNVIRLLFRIIKKNLI